MKILLLWLSEVFPLSIILSKLLLGEEKFLSLLKELRSQLKVEEFTLEEVIKQAPVMTAMFANSLNSGFEDGNSSGLKYYHEVRT